MKIIKMACAVMACIGVSALYAQCGWLLNDSGMGPPTETELPSGEGDGETPVVEGLEAGAAAMAVSKVVLFNVMQAIFNAYGIDVTDETAASVSAVGKEARPVGDLGNGEQPSPIDCTTHLDCDHSGACVGGVCITYACGEVWSCEYGTEVYGDCGEYWECDNQAGENKGCCVALPFGDPLDSLSCDETPVEFSSAGVYVLVSCRVTSQGDHLDFDGQGSIYDRTGVCFDHKVVGNLELNGCARFQMSVSCNGDISIGFSTYDDFKITFLDNTSIAALSKTMNIGLNDVFVVGSMTGGASWTAVGGDIRLDDVWVGLYTSIDWGREDIRCGCEGMYGQVIRGRCPEGNPLRCVVMSDYCRELCGADDYGYEDERHTRWVVDGVCQIRSPAEEGTLGGDMIKGCSCWRDEDPSYCICGNRGLTPCMGIQGCAIGEVTPEGEICLVEKSCELWGGTCDADGCCVGNCYGMSCAYADLLMEHRQMSCDDYGGDCCAANSGGIEYCDGNCCVMAEIPFECPYIAAFDTALSEEDAVQFLWRGLDIWCDSAAEDCCLWLSYFIPGVLETDEHGCCAISSAGPVCLPIEEIEMALDEADAAGILAIMMSVQCDIATEDCCAVFSGMALPVTLATNAADGCCVKVE